MTKRQRQTYNETKTAGKGGDRDTDSCRERFRGTGRERKRVEDVERKCALK